MLQNSIKCNLKLRAEFCQSWIITLMLVRVAKKAGDKGYDYDEIDDGNDDDDKYNDEYKK